MRGPKEKSVVAEAAPAPATQAPATRAAVARLEIPAFRQPMDDLLKISSIRRLRTNSGVRPPVNDWTHWVQPPGTPCRRRPDFYTFLSHVQSVNVVSHVVVHGVVHARCSRGPSADLMGFGAAGVAVSGTTLWDDIVRCPPFTALSVKNRSQLCNVGACPVQPSGTCAVAGTRAKGGPCSAGRTWPRPRAAAAARRPWRSCSSGRRWSAPPRAC